MVFDQYEAPEQRPPYAAAVGRMSMKAMVSSSESMISAGPSPETIAQKMQSLAPVATAE